VVLEVLCGEVCCSVLQYVAVWCSVVQCGAVCYSLEVLCGALCCCVFECIAVCCSVLQSVAVCCSVLQRVADTHTHLAVNCHVLEVRSILRVPYMATTIHIYKYVYIFMYIKTYVHLGSTIHGTHNIYIYMYICVCICPHTSEHMSIEGVPYMAPTIYIYIYVYVYIFTYIKTYVH